MQIQRPCDKVTSLLITEGIKQPFSQSAPGHKSIPRPGLMPTSTCSLSSLLFLALFSVLTETKWDLHSISQEFISAPEKMPPIPSFISLHATSQSSHTLSNHGSSDVRPRPQKRMRKLCLQEAVPDSLQLHFNILINTAP